MRIVERHSSERRPFGNIFATKERKKRIDNNLYGLFSLRSLRSFAANPSLVATLPRRAFAALR
jgi:hypothetical protein